MKRRDFLKTTTCGALAPIALPVIFAPPSPTSLLFPDHTPDFIQWSIDGHVSADPADFPFSPFQLQYLPSRIPQRSTFRKSVDLAVQKIDGQRRGSKVALMYSGGTDSEIIAYALAKNAIPFEMYMVDVWGLSHEKEDLSHAQAFAKKINRPLNIIRIEKADYFQNHLIADFEETTCTFPTYLLMTHAFKQIPKSQFIVLGEGDLHKKGAMYERIESQTSHAPGDLFFASSELTYRLWSRRHNRKGQYYFYNSTPELVVSALEHPLTVKKGLQVDTRAMLAAEFPELRQREKFSNWRRSFYDNNLMRDQIYSFISQDPKWSALWNSKGKPTDIGAFANPLKIIRGSRGLLA